MHTFIIGYPFFVVFTKNVFTVSDIFNDVMMIDVVLIVVCVFQSNKAHKNLQNPGGEPEDEGVQTLLYVLCLIVNISYMN